MKKMTENGEVRSTKNKESYYACFIKRHCRVREKNKANWKVRWVGADRRLIRPVAREGGSQRMQCPYLYTGISSPLPCLRCSLYFINKHLP
jgi:hypothetical protein